MVSEFCIKMVCPKRASLISYLQYRKVLHKFLSLQILVSITSWCRSGLQTVLGRFPLTEHEEFTGFSSLVSMFNRLYLRAPTELSKILADSWFSARWHFLYQFSFFSPTDLVQKKWLSFYLIFFSTTLTVFY